MNDEELIAALRRTLHSRAEAVRPSSARALQFGPPEDDRDELADRRLRRLMDRPWVMAGVGLAAAAAVAGLVVGLTLPGQSSTGLKTGSTGPSPSLPVVTTVPVSTPAPTAPATTTPTTVPSVPVPASFEPVSATFVGPHTGWVLGTVTCGGSPCAAVARTTDGGQTWGAVGAPHIIFAGQEAIMNTWIRFLNTEDGWIVSPSGSGPGPSVIWFTQDGGQTWKQGNTPGGAYATVYSLEASKGEVYAVSLVQGAQAERVFSAPLGTTDWQESPVSLPRGAGPVASAQVVLFGSSGWIIDIDRTVIGGAMLGTGDAWSNWKPPCADANGSGVLSATSATQLFAVCDENEWGTSGENLVGQWLFSSNNGGSSFQAVAKVPATQVSGLASAPPAGNAQSPNTEAADTLVAASDSGLLATFDGGQTWQNVYPVAISQEITFVGFTTATQAVAVVRETDGSSTTMLMSHDGGHTWSAVHF
jgi:photosystem II stability/assembly factor-like uncharacterized protein